MEMTSSERLKEIEGRMNLYRGLVDNWIEHMHSEDFPWLITRVKRLTEALSNFEKGYGCFCGCPFTRRKEKHSEACYFARKVLEKE